MKKKKQLIDEHGKILQFDENTLTNLANVCDVFPDFYDRDPTIILPDIPTDRIRWELNCRAYIKGEPNRIEYMPMIKEMLLDPHPYKIEILARQWGKTTGFASELAYRGSTHYDYDQTYVNFELESLKTFSDNKFRKDVFAVYPLSEYIEGVSKWGSMTKVTLKTRSTIDMVTALNNWRHLQGKSNETLIVDEGQDIDWTNFDNARETLADTMGDLIIGGIGGFVDTQYHRMFMSSNQMEWKYDRGEPYKGYENMSWRRELEEQCFDKNGLVYNDAMKEIVRGKWVAKVPKNYAIHGYTISQPLNPRIPLTRRDATELYHVAESFSIEAKQEDPDTTTNNFLRNIMAVFVEGELKPITTKMILSLFDKNVSLTKAEDVDHNAGRIYVGVDFGGGGKTIIWIWQCLDDKGPIFKLLWVEKVETNDFRKQTEIAINLIDAYEADKVVADANPAQQCQPLQQHFGRRVIRNSYQVRPEKPIPTRLEMQKLRREMRYLIDRTFSIDRIIDLIRYGYKDAGVTLPRMILPGADMAKVKWIIPQFTCIEGTEENLKSTGQTYIKYSHKDSEPDDALQACNYAYIAWYLGRSSGKVEFFDLKPKDPYQDGYSETQRSM